MCAGISQIALDRFLDVRKAWSEPSTQIATKAEELRANYACFGQQTTPAAPVAATNSTNHRPSHHKGRHWRDDRKDHGQHGVANRTDVVKIGSRELSRENLARKDFMALMNKLTEQNKDHIFQTIKNVYREDCTPVYVQILWDIMQRSPTFIDLYMAAFQVLVKSSKSSAWAKTWAAIWHDFKVERLWQPSADIIGEDGDYDEFCDFVKWKKRTLAAMNVLPLLAKQNWIPIQEVEDMIQNILHECDAELARVNGSKVSDAYIDELSAILKNGDDAWKGQVWTWACNWEQRSHELRNATRFKMLDLTESCASKLKAPVHQNNSAKKR